ncbi:MAG: hypothetical protein LBO66_05370 [Deltaproteobacteria bacterium]|jgi:hypothetical protein|nr:hypothetical protein [Deltaproteobacteria bacterium]
MIKLEQFSFDNLPFNKSNFKDAVKAAEALVDKLELQETRFERIGQFNYLGWIYANVLTPQDLGLIRALFIQTVPNPNAIILIAPSDLGEHKPYVSVTVTPWLPLKEEEIALKFNEISKKNLDSLTSLNKGERPSFSAVMSHVAAPLKEYVVSKIPQDLLE